MVFIQTARLANENQLQVSLRKKQPLLNSLYFAQKKIDIFQSQNILHEI